VSAAPSPLPAARGRGRLVVCLLLAAVVLAAGLAGGRWAYLASQRRRALDLARLGDFSGAAPLLERAAARDPDDDAVAAALARGYLDAGDDEAARPALDRWCRLRPDDPEPFRLRMALLRKEKSFTVAQTDGLRLLALGDGDDDLVLTVARLSAAAGDYEKAEELSRRVLQSDPKRFDARSLLAQALRERGRKQQAAELLDELLKEKPTDPTTMMTRGSLAVEMGEYGRAIPLLEGVLLRDPSRQRTARAQLVIAYAQAGRADDARRVQRELHALQEAEVLRDALQSQPDDPDVQARAGRAWLRSGQVKQGLELLERLLQKHPDHAAAHQALAEYYESVGEKGLAAKHRRAGAKPPP
jgi:Flp pilus assembly protein TadD